MAVSRRVHFFSLGCDPFEEVWPRDSVPEFQRMLNAKLGPHERIVHVEQKEKHSHKWIVITEELIMGPVP